VLRSGLLRTLFGRLAAAQLLFTLLAALGFIAALEFSHTQYHREQAQRKNLRLAEHFLREKRELFGPDLARPERVAEALAELAEVNHAVDLYWLSPKGDILGSSVATSALKTKSVDLEPLERMLSGRADLPVLGVDPIDPERSKVFAVAGVGDPADPAGDLYVILRGDEAALVFGAGNATVFRRSLALALGVSLVALASTLLIVFVILRPFRNMSRRVEAFSRSDFTRWTPLGSAPDGAATTDIDRLSRHLDHMAVRITDLLARLKGDELRMREMFAGISHDLRTPLTVIRGNLETLQLHGLRLSSEERDAILGAAVSQTRALGDLVGRLFDLAKLQSPEFTLRREPVSLSELLQDVALKFATPAQARGISVETEGLDAHAMTDIDALLIERVLDNLIGNAIEHAAGADRIRVVLRDQNDERYRVEVHDNGRGLAADQLEALASATDAGRGLRRLRELGGGLGLLIVHRILALHGATLELASGTGKGTIFTFSLPKAGAVASGGGTDAHRARGAPSPEPAAFP
jgi:signal transduction histidine kinase